MENPSFFAVLPAAVRYDARLSASEKIFFAEITALTEAEGYCYAANAYFCELYGAGDRTVRRWLEHLQAAGYIEVEPAAGGEAPHPRRIWLAGRTVRGADVDAAADGAAKNGRGAAKNGREGRPKMAGPTSEEQNNNNNTGARVREDGSEQAAKAPAAPEKTLDELFDKLLKDSSFVRGPDEFLYAALEKFISLRAAKKRPMTPWAIELLCRKLVRMATGAKVQDGVDYMTQVLEESILNDWDGVYALKEYEPRPQPATQPRNGADKPRVIGADADISALF